MIDVQSLTKNLRLTPSLWRSRAGPTPDRSNKWGDPIAPADRITSLRAYTAWLSLKRSNWMPMARLCPLNRICSVVLYCVLFRFSRMVVSEIAEARQRSSDR